MKSVLLELRIPIELVLGLLTGCAWRFGELSRHVYFKVFGYRLRQELALLVDCFQNDAVTFKTMVLFGQQSFCEARRHRPLLIQRDLLGAFD